MNKTYLMGDVHGQLDFQKVYRYGSHTKDRLIQLGDFGLVFHPLGSEGSHNENRLMNELQQFWGEVLFVDGNHENFDRLNKFPMVQRYGGPVRQLAPRVFWLQRGYVYTIDGKTFFVMGGGDSIDKARRVEGLSWWKEEQPSYTELNRGMDALDAVDWKVDYVLTHTCPTSTKLELGSRMRLVMSSDHLENYLDNVKEQLTYKKWYFGHFHVDTELADNMTCLYHMMLELGQDLDPEDDDLKSGFYADDQTKELPPLASNKQELKDQMLSHYLRNQAMNPGFNDTKIWNGKDET